MKRKTSPLPTRIWTFGCLPPTTHADLVEAQFRLAHNYRNKLTEIERTRLAAVRAAIGSAPGVAEAQAALDKLAGELETARGAIKSARAGARSTAVDVSVPRATITALKPQLTAARAALKAAKAAQRSDEIQAAIELADIVAAEAVKAARAASGLYWGTYLLVEKAAEQARSAVFDPRFRPWTGEGRIGVQIQETRTPKGMAKGVPTSMLADDTRLQIDPVPAEAYASRSHQNRKRTRTRVRIRIGSVENREPLFAEFPMILHRPLPADGLIKWAWIKRTRVGVQYRYELQLSIEAASFVALPKDGPAVAIDVGWRATAGAGELRIGYFVGGDGRKGEILGPTSNRDGANRGIVSRLAHADSLRVIQDRLFNETRSALLAYLADGALPALPDTFTRHLTNLAQWRSALRLGELVWQHRTELAQAGSNPATQAIVQRLEYFRSQRRHLHKWEAAARANTLARRRDYYRCLAADFASRYSTVILEAFDLRAMARDKPPEATAKDPSANERYYQRAAAVSEFRRALQSACAARGAVLVTLDPAYTTRTCHACGALETWDTRVLMHRCSQCQAEWDQDENAARNLLKLWESGSAVQHAGQALDTQDHAGKAMDQA